MVRLCDHFSALMEADISIKHGITSSHLQHGRDDILKNYLRDEEINGIHLAEFFKKRFLK